MGTDYRGGGRESSQRRRVFTEKVQSKGHELAELQPGLGTSMGLKGARLNCSFTEAAYTGGVRESY